MVFLQIFQMSEETYPDGSRRANQKIGQKALKDRHLEFEGVP
jgi:hypothetical protein